MGSSPIQCTNIKKENKMPKLTKLVKVNESITVHRYDNAWMAEVGGRNENEEWRTCKIVCNTEDELIDIIKEWNMMEVDN